MGGFAVRGAWPWAVSLTGLRGGWRGRGIRCYDLTERKGRIIVDFYESRNYASEFQSKSLSSALTNIVLVNTLQSKILHNSASKRKSKARQSAAIIIV